MILSLWCIWPLGIRLGIGVDAMAKRPVGTADTLDGHGSLNLARFKSPHAVLDRI